MKGFCGINYGTATVSQRIALLLTLDPAGLNCFDKKKALSLKKMTCNELITICKSKPCCLFLCERDARQTQNYRQFMMP